MGTAEIIAAATLGLALALDSASGNTWVRQNTEPLQLMAAIVPLETLWWEWEQAIGMDAIDLLVPEHQRTDERAAELLRVEPGEPVLCIGLLHVTDGFERRGLARHTVERVEAWAVSQGIRRSILVASWAWGDPQGFWRRMGYRPFPGGEGRDGVLMIRDLS